MIASKRVMIAVVAQKWDEKTKKISSTMVNKIHCRRASLLVDTKQQTTLSGVLKVAMEIVLAANTDEKWLENFQAEKKGWFALRPGQGVNIWVKDDKGKGPKTQNYKMLTMEDFHPMQDPLITLHSR